MGLLRDWFDEMSNFRAHGESVAETRRKPEVIDAILRDNLTPVETGPVNPESYEHRLRAVLTLVPTYALEALRENKVIVVLDQRLAGNGNGIRGNELFGVFSSVGPAGKVVTLLDNGANPDKDRYNDSAADYGPRMLKELADKLLDGDITEKDGNLYAASCTRYIGRGTQFIVEWRNAEDFDENVLKGNPAAQAPTFRKALLPPSKGLAP